MKRMHGLGSHLVCFPDIPHRDKHRWVMTVTGVLALWRSRLRWRECNVAAHLAALICISPGFFCLPFYGHAIFQRLQYTAGPRTISI